MSKMECRKCGGKADDTYPVGAIPGGVDLCRGCRVAYHYRMTSDSIDIMNEYQATGILMRRAQMGDPSISRYEIGDIVGSFQEAERRLMDDFKLWLMENA